MRCPLCGTDFFGNDGICPSCGNYLGDKDNQTGTANARPVYNMPFMQPVNQQADQFGYGQSSQRTSSKKSVLIVLIVIIASLVWFLIVLFNRISTKEYDYGSFKITLPLNMKESKDIGENSFFSNNEYDSGVYDNGNVRFAYIVSDSFENGSVSDNANNAEYTKLYISLLASSYKQNGIGDYKEYEMTDDTLRCVYKDDVGNKGYCHIKIVPHNNRWYIFFLTCSKNNIGSYESRFEKWIGSVKFK